MVRGFWRIMVPERRDPVTPDVVIAPLVGFSGLYRLGHGGGYFDRTLTVLLPKPLAVGIGTEAGRLNNYIPQAHDIPMDAIVTEAAIYCVAHEFRRSGGRLHRREVSLAVFFAVPPISPRLPIR